jgi:hypothetical protein
MVGKAIAEVLIAATATAEQDLLRGLGQPPLIFLGNGAGGKIPKAGQGIRRGKLALLNRLQSLMPELPAK